MDNFVIEVHINQAHLIFVLLTKLCEFSKEQNFKYFDSRDGFTLRYRNRSVHLTVTSSNQRLICHSGVLLVSVDICESIKNNFSDPGIRCQSYRKRPQKSVHTGGEVVILFGNILNCFEKKAQNFFSMVERFEIVVDRDLQWGW